MDIDHKDTLYLDRAKNELDFAKVAFKLSNDKKLKLDFELKEDSTFFSNVISNSYYCIFFSAKAMLSNKGIHTYFPDEHKKTLEEFEKMVDSGEIDMELLKIYKEMVVKADELLGIFRLEKSKRGKYTYTMLPQANMEPAKESVEHAEKFMKNINLIIKKSHEEKSKSLR